MKTLAGFALKVFDWFLLAGMLLVIHPTCVVAAAEEKFDVLQVGTQTFHNVTVTTKSKNYVFLVHDKGMSSIKVADLPHELLPRLGYVDPTVPKAVTNAATAIAKQTLAKLETAEVKGLEEKLAKTWRNQLAMSRAHLPEFTPNLLAMVLAVVLTAYLFFCHCCKRICQKTGKPPGALIWVPGLQALPLLSAAEMSRWWFLAMVVPGLNLVPHVLWCVNIARARGKTVLVAVMLIIPLLNLPAFLFLAFSDGGPVREKEDRRVEVMSLESA